MFLCIFLNDYKINYNIKLINADTNSTIQFSTSLYINSVLRRGFGCNIVVGEINTTTQMTGCGIVSLVSNDKIELRIISSQTQVGTGIDRNSFFSTLDARATMNITKLR